MFQLINYYTAVYRPLLVKSIQVISLMPTLVTNQSLTIQQLQKSSIQCTIYIGHPHVQYSVIYGIWILISHIFSSKTSVYSKKAAVNSAFNCPLYRGRVAVVYRAFYVVTLCAFTTFFHCHFYLISAHLVIYIVDLYLYQWPPSLYYCGNTLLAWRQVFTYYYSSSHISCSLSAAYRCSTSWLIYLGVLPLQQGLAPHIYFSTQYMSFSTGVLILQLLFALLLCLYRR